MNNKLVKILFVVLLAVFVILNTIVISNADDESKTEIIFKTNSLSVKKGEEIKVYVYLNKIELQDGIQGIDGTLTYNKDVLEPITTNDTTYNGWNATWNTENSKLVIDRGNLATVKQEVAELTFKVKEDTDAPNTKIEYSQIIVSNGTDEEDVEDAEIELTITEANEEDDEGNSEDNDEKKDDDKSGEKEDNKDEETENNDSEKTDKDEKTEEKEQEKNNDEKTEEKEQEKNNDEKTKEEKKEDTNAKENKQVENTAKVATDTTKKTSGTLPYTGVVEWIILAVVALGAIGTISYKKYQKYKNL